MSTYFYNKDCLGNEMSYPKGVTKNTLRKGREVTEPVGYVLSESFSGLFLNWLNWQDSTEDTYSELKKQVSVEHFLPVVKEVVKTKSGNQTVDRKMVEAEVWNLYLDGNKVAVLFNKEDVDHLKLSYV